MVIGKGNEENQGVANSYDKVPLRACGKIKSEKPTGLPPKGLKR